MEEKDEITNTTKEGDSISLKNDNKPMPTAHKIGVDIPKSNEEILNHIIKFEKLGKEEDKILIQFKAAGNAPILKNNKIRLGGFNKFASLGEFLKTSLKNTIKDNESLFLYCNSNFAPSPSVYVRDLYNNFSISGELIVYYALTEAWG